MHLSEQAEGTANHLKIGRWIGQLDFGGRAVVHLGVRDIANQQRLLRREVIGWRDVELLAVPSINFPAVELNHQAGPAHPLLCGHPEPGQSLRDFSSDGIMNVAVLGQIHKFPSRVFGGTVACRFSCLGGVLFWVCQVGCNEELLAVGQPFAGLGLLLLCSHRIR